MLNILLVIFSVQCIMANYLQTCSKSIVEIYATNPSVFAYSDHDLDVIRKVSGNVSHVCVNLQKPLSKIHMNLKFGFYLIVSPDGNTLHDFFAKIYRTKRYNAKAKILIILTGEESLLDKVFGILWEFYLTNVLVITKTCKVYTYYPISVGKCVKSTPNFLFTCEEFNESVGLYKEGNAFSFEGCEVRISALAGLTYYVGEGSYEENKGFEVVMLREILKRLRLKARFSYYSATSKTDGLPDGKYTAMRKKLNNKETDIVLGFASLLESLAIEFDYSFITYFPHFAFFVPLAQQSDRWKNIFLIFDKSIWIGLVAISLLVTGIWYLIDRRKREIFCYYLYTFSIMYSVIHKLPKNKKIRLVLVTWMFFCLVLNSCYQSLMISFLFKPISEKQIASLEDIVESKIPFGGYQWLRSYFNTNDSSTVRGIYTGFRNCPISGDECLEWLQKGEFCFLADTRIMIYALSEKKHTNVHMLPPSITTFATFYLDKGSPFTSRINELILTIRENGLNYKWDTFEKATKPKLWGSEAQALRLIHLQSAFLLHLLGIILSIFTFILEILFKT